MPQISDFSFDNQTFNSQQFNHNDDETDSGRTNDEDDFMGSDTNSVVHNDSSLDMQQLLLNFQENEPIFDNELLYPTPKESVIVHFKNEKLVEGTVEALITYVTSPEVLDYQFLVDFFLTFRTYIDALPLLELLLCRLSWCLKNSLSNDLNRSSIGRLVLVRTFVTIRHWLLNHFQDDFVNNNLLRQLFTNTINELAKYEQYIGTDFNNLQTKIIKDLKKNYLTMCSIYWNLEIIEYPSDMLHYTISSYHNFNNSRLSTVGLSHLNDPSTRRSTLLYMFDNQSSSNILSESFGKKAQSSSSLARSPQLPTKTPLETFLSKNSNQRSKSLFKNEQNSFLYPKASLNALELDRNKLRTNDSSSIDQLYSNICTVFSNQAVSGFVSLDKFNLEKNATDGFTTRGNIEIFEDSKVSKIESLAKEINPIFPESKAPEKRSINQKVEIKTLTKTAKPFISSPKPDQATKQNNKTILQQKQKSKTKKRSFLKSLFNHHDKENVPAGSVNDRTKAGRAIVEPKVLLTNSETDCQRQEQQQSQKQCQSEVKLNYRTEESSSTHNVIEDLEKTININENNIDYLEELVIRDYQLMMQLPTFKQRYSRQLKNSNRKSVLSTAIDLGNRESKFDPHDSPTKSGKESYNMNQLENLINSKNNTHGLNNVDEAQEKSFQTPPDTMNWSESLEIDDSHNDVFIDMGVTNEELQDVSEIDSTVHSNDHRFRSYGELPVRGRSSLQVYRSSLKQLHAPQKGKCSSDPNLPIGLNNNRISNGFSDREENRSVDTTTNRFSINMIGRSSMISNKSYMTYDSDISASSRGVAFNSINADMDENKLRKKHAISNLRVDNQSISDTDDESLGNEDAKKISDVGNLKNAENQSTTSIATAKALDMESLEIMQELPFYSFISSEKSTNSGISILPSPTPSQTCYNGLSQTDINELAAIPDEKLDGDPLHYTLSKLRGERKKPKVILGLNDTNQDVDIGDEETHRKHAVAIVCQSPIDSDFSEANVNKTLKDDCCNSDYDSTEEARLERQVKDLYISNNSAEMNKSNAPSTPSKNQKLEMNMISTQSLGMTRDNGNTLTRVSTGKLLKDDGERSCFEMQSLLATPKALNCSKQILSVTQIMQGELHIPFIFKYDSEQLAKQMTLIERDIIMEVEWKELINLKWDQPISPYNSWLRLLLDLSDKTGLQMITLRFNLVNNWIISEILLCKDFALRVLAITRFVQLAQTCRKIQNYGTLFQIMLALNSEVMKQLKSTWIRVDPGTILRFKELKDLTSPNSNFKNYRDEIEKIVPSKGFIPFLPLELSDLTMYSEMPTIVSSKLDNSTEIDSLDEFEDGSDSYELVSFEKFTITGQTVKKTLRYIEWARFYSFEADNDIISKCLYISSLSEEDMELCLKEIET